LEKELTMDIPIVCEYKDVFPKEIPRIPVNREFEFEINLEPRTKPITKALTIWLQLN
jgi:hypothetical protein